MLDNVLALFIIIINPIMISLSVILGIFIGKVAIYSMIFWGLLQFIMIIIVGLKGE